MFSTYELPYYYLLIQRRVMGIINIVLSDEKCYAYPFGQKE